MRIYDGCVVSECENKRHTMGAVCVGVERGTYDNCGVSEYEKRGHMMVVVWVSVKREDRQ